MKQLPSVSYAYNFTLSGPGQYSIEPSNLFTYVDVDGTLKDFHAIVGDVAEVNLSGALVVPRVHEQRITKFVNCSSAEQTKLKAAAASAQTYAKNAHSYISGISSPTPRYLTWFGAYVRSRKNFVQNHFLLISSRNFSSFTYDCTCVAIDTYAYVCAYIFQS